MKPNIGALTQRFLNTPMLLQPIWAESLIPSLQMISAYDSDSDADWKPFEVVQGVAIIPVQGVLLQKLGSCYSFWGMTGYDGIRANFLNALTDDDVKAIVLDIDSPGGECAGNMDLADMIYAARGTKPIWAVLNETGYSAAYALASACDRVCIPRTGGAGSIGVIAILADISRALDKDGVTVNVITFGARKADGQPFMELSDAARARFQADVNMLGNLFVDTVARNRGLAPSAVLGQQAGCFMGADAVRAGLADMVAAPDAAFAQLLSTL